jgi:hypothetical protein
MATTMTRIPHPTWIPRRWRLRDIRRARLTRWLLLGSVLLMFAMQSALAAYACAMPSGMGPAMAMSTSATDASMATTCPEMQHAPTDRLLCAKHCASEASAPTDARPLSVPPNLLTALAPVLPVVAMQTQTTLAPERRYRLRAPPPPITLLFCSLLI